MSETKFVYLDSAQRLSGTNSNFRFRLGVENIKAYDRIVLLTANIPKSYYLIEEDENTFTLTEGVLTATITIPPATYNRSTLRTTVETLLNSESPTTWTYTVSVPSNTGGDNGKFVFGVSGNGGVQPSFTFSTFVANSLGFDNSTTNTFVANQLTSVRIPSLQLEDNVRVHCSLVRNDSSDGGDAILESIPAIQNPYFGNIVWQCPSADDYSRAITRPEQIVSFQLTDEANNELDLNGVNWTGTLKLYKSGEDKVSQLVGLMRLFLGQNLLQQLK